MDSLTVCLSLAAEAFDPVLVIELLINFPGQISVNSLSDNFEVKRNLENKRDLWASKNMGN